MATVLTWDGVAFADADESDAKKKANKGVLHAYLDGIWVCNKDGKAVPALQRADFYAEPSAAVEEEPKPKRKKRAS